MYSSSIPRDVRCIRWILLLSGWICCLANAQTAADGYRADLTPPPSNSSGEINKIQILPDAKVLVAGRFDAINGQPRRNIARLLPDGRVDLSFGNEIGPDRRVDDFVVLPDGKIVIIGTFNRVDDEFGFSSIARLNADGSLDTAFNPPLSGSFRAIARQSDGRLLVSTGDLSRYPRVQRLNANGTLDTTFVQPDVSPEDSRFLVESIAIDASDRILLGGSFRTVAGVSRILIARLHPDGTLDSSFESPFALSGSIRTVRSIVPDIHGRIYVGGGFFDIDDGQGTIRRLVVRLLEDGSLDTAYNPNVNDPFASPVETMVLQPDGQLLIGGDFTDSGTGLRRLIRLDLDGQIDPSLQPPDINFFGSVRGIDVQADGQILFGGRRLLRLNSTGELDVDFDPQVGPDAAPDTMTWQTPAGYLIGGDFNQYNNTAQDRITRIASDGSLDTTFQVGDGPNGAVEHVTIGLDRESLVAGAFTEFDGLATDALTRLSADGVPNALFFADFGSTGVVKDAIALQSGKYLVVGSFTEVNGISRNRIARLNPDGTLDTFFDPGTGANDTIHAVSILPSGRLWIGGEFTEFDGESRVRVAKLLANGQLDTLASLVPSVDGTVRAMALQTDGAVLIGGDFGNVDSTTRPGLARIALNRFDESFDAQLDAAPVQPVVNSIQVQSDGKILIGGSFTSVQGQPIDRITRLNADGSLDPDFGNGFGAVFANGDPAAVTDLALLPNGKLLVSGDFDTLGGLPRARIGRILLPDAVEQSLSLEDGVIRWTPDGSLPVATSVRFSASSDGINFTPAAINTQPELIDGVWQQQRAAVDAGVAWIRVTPKFDPHGEVNFTRRILADAQIDFQDSLVVGSIKVGRERKGSLRVRNEGDARLVITGFEGLGAPFSFDENGGCGPLPITVEPTFDVFSGCLLGFAFTPETAGTFSQTFEILSNSKDAPTTFTLTGTGVAPELTLTPNALEFGNQPLDSTSDGQTIVLSNSSTVDLELQDIVVSPPFGTATNGCQPLPLELAPGQDCELAIVFNPQQAGFVTGEVSITSDAANSPETLALSGTGTQPVLSLEPGGVAFDGVAVGSTSTEQVVVLSNLGEADLRVESIEAPTAPFTATNDTCTADPFVLVPQASCELGFRFAPNEPGLISADLNITSNGSSSPDVLRLTGTGLIAEIAVDPTTMTFAEQALGTVSPGRTVTVTGTGTLDLSIDRIDIVGPAAADFSVGGGDDDCTGAVLSTDQSCTFTLRFSPEEGGTRQAEVRIISNAAAGANRIELRGTADDPDVIYADGFEEPW